MMTFREALIKAAIGVGGFLAFIGSIVLAVEVSYVFFYIFTVPMITVFIAGAIYAWNNY